MAGLRRALLFASAGRYLVMAVNLGSAILLARLLTPAQFGVAALGTAILGIAEAFRELGSIAYLVQQKDLTQEKIRTVFTVSLIVTLAMTGVLIMLSGLLAGFYQLPAIARYIQVVALSYAIAPFAHPIYAVLSRDMAFDKLAVMDVLTALLNAAAAVCLVLLGFGTMGLAWATVVSAAAWTLLGLYVRRDLSAYRPSLREWRSVLAFGVYGSATAALYKTSESLFYLILGKILDPRAVGLCQRAAMLAQFPERVVLAGVGAVALPAFSEEARRGRALEAAYLGTLQHVTAVQWPALILFAVLAEPIVTLLLGPQWSDVVPLLRIFALSLMLNFSTSLNYPIQVAAGGIRHTVPLAFAQTAISLALLTFAAHFGLQAVALSTFISIPINVGLSTLAVRTHVPFRWREFVGTLARSAVVAAFSAVGPLAVVVASPRTGNLSPASSAMAIALSGAGWLAGLWLTSHPLFQENPTNC